MKKIIFLLTIALLAVLSAPALAVDAEEAPDPKPMALLQEAGGIFQNGAFSGPQTIPGEPVLMEAAWERALYQAVLNGWKNCEERVSVAHLDIREKDNDIVWEVIQKVINNQPELFYAKWYDVEWDNWSADKGWQLVEIELQYYEFSYCGYSNINQVLYDFDAAVDRALAVVEPGMSDLEKALALHDYLVLNCAYNWDVATTDDFSEYWQNTPNWQLATTFGVLVKGDPICQTYSLAYQLLLDRVGIDSILIGSDSMDHVWNGVEIGGNWYQTDVT